MDNRPGHCQDAVSENLARGHAYELAAGTLGLGMNGFLRGPSQEPEFTAASRMNAYHIAVSVFGFEAVTQARIARGLPPTP